MEDNMNFNNDMDEIIPTNQDINYEELVEELNRLYTPILISQNMEKEISHEVSNEIMNSNPDDEYTERNIISFDDPARMSQLIATCALLIARKKNTPNWQKFAQASQAKKESKIDIQKEEYNFAKILAEKYLVKVSTSNNSSVARDAATGLLPHTQQ